MTLERQKQNQDYEVQRVNEKFIEFENQFFKIETQIKTLQDKFESTKERLADQDFHIENNKEELVKAHQKMENSFDKWFTTVGNEQRSIREIVTELNSVVSAKAEESKHFSENI